MEAGRGPSGRPSSPLAAQARGVAAVVWQDLPGSFNELSVTIRGLGTELFSQSRLTSLLGPRPATLDQTKLSTQAARSGAVAVAVLSVGVAVILALVLFLVVRVRRGRDLHRRRQAALMMATLPPEAWALAGSGAPTRRRSRRPGPQPAGNPLAPEPPDVQDLVGWPPPQPGYAAPPPGAPRGPSTTYGARRDPSAPLHQHPATHPPPGTETASGP